jgi:hypothetical protein
LRIALTVERADLGVVAEAGVVDQDVDAAHLLDGLVDGASVVGVGSDVGLDAVRARLLHRSIGCARRCGR